MPLTLADGVSFSRMIYPTPYIYYISEYHWKGVLLTDGNKVQSDLRKYSPKFTSMPLSLHLECTWRSRFIWSGPRASLGSRQSRARCTLLLGRFSIWSHLSILLVFLSRSSYANWVWSPWVHYKNRNCMVSRDYCRVGNSWVHGYRLRDTIIRVDTGEFEVPFDFDQQPSDLTTHAN